MRPRSILFVDVSPSPSYGGSKRVLTNIVGTIDRARWTPHVLYYRKGAYVGEVAAMGIWARAPNGIPGQRGAGEGAVGDAASGSSDAGDARSSPGVGVRKLVAGAGVRRDASGWVERSWPRGIARDLRACYRFWCRGLRWSRLLDPFLPHGIDLIHFNGPMHDHHYEWAHLARRFGIPFVTHEHGPWRVPPAAFREVARRSASVLCLTRERVEQVTWFCHGRVRADLVPNGVAVEKLTPRRGRDTVRAEIGVGASTLLLITAAHVEPYKGHLLAVSAADLLRREGVDFRWVFCGTTLDREYLRTVTARVRELSLQDRITFLGERTDLPDLLAASDLLVHASIGPEAFGMVVVEALGVGTPAIGPSEGAVPSIIRDGQDGLLYEPRDPRAMVGAILRLAQTPDERVRMGRSGRERVAKVFSVEVQVDELCAIYERALGTHSTHPEIGRIPLPDRG